MSTPLSERLWSRVVEVEGGCWEYRGRLRSDGYGVIGAGGRGGRTLRTHRVAYELMVGPIPDGLQIDHLCRNRACCNPYHLDPVPGAENSRRAGEARQLCPHGHELRPRVPGTRRPECPTCNRARARRHYEKKRATA